MLKTNVPAVYFLSFIFSAIVISCGPPKVEDSKTIAEDHNEAKFDAADAKDAAFITDTAEINLEEIALGNLAEKNGMMPEVQTLGNLIKEDHQNALRKLRALAFKKSISIPDSLTQKGKQSYDNLMAQPGKDFDRAYAGLMVEHHKKAIDKFEFAIKNAKDADIVAWATLCLPALRHHLDRSMECQLKSDKLRE
jgi:putative membrane protein